MSVVTPYMVNANDWNWGLKTGWFYAGVGLPFTIAIWFLIPETAGYVSVYMSAAVLLLLSSLCVGLLTDSSIWFSLYSRSSAELDELFERKVKPWRFHKTTTATQRSVQAKGEEAG
jgi:hypothetical protein